MMWYIDRNTKDPLSISEQKQRLVLILALICAALMLPFIVSHFLESRPTLGIVGAVVVATFLINAVSIARKNSYHAKSIQYILVPTIALYIVLSIKTQGLIGILWCYPAILSCYFLLPEKQAWIANTILLFLVSPIVLATQDMGLGWRMVATFLVVSFLSGFFVNIISKQREKLQHLAITDPMTGLFNRQNLASDINNTIAFAKATDTEASLVMIDVDHFKLINDNFGHETGDRVLKQVADVFKTRCRKTDKIYRIGGEEFLLLLPQTSSEASRQLAEELRQSIERLNFEQNINVTASFGITVCKSNESWQSWLSRSDKCLYQAKFEGRNRVTICC